MIEPMIRKVLWDGDHYSLALFSDLHLGANDSEEDKLRKDLEQSCNENRRILINGDVVEAILSTDMKRFTPSKILSGRDDALNEITEYAVNFLKPYADYIDLIGTGNHEQSTIRYNSFDIIGAICVLLNRERSKSLEPIHRAGYQGYAQYRINDGNNKLTSVFTIYHHHGIGGSSPVSKGMIDFNRIIYSHDADLWWIGHKHVGTHDPYIIRDGLSRMGLYERKIGQAVFTPGYKKAVNVDKDGYNIYYSDQFYSMQACGYAAVNLFRDGHTQRLKERYEVISR